MQPRSGFVTTVLLLSLVAPTMAVPAAAGHACAFPVTETDATGTRVTISAEPSRVVTLGPSAAQTMWEIGAREKVVGVTKYASYLDGAESRTRVSTAEQMVSYETVVDLNPDLVLAPNVVSRETVERLRDVGVTVYYFQSAETIEDVYGKTRRIGRLTGECRGAAETVSWMKERIGVAREATEGQEHPTVLYLFFGYTAGKGTFINETIEAAGGDNVAVNANVSGYRKVSQEVVVREDPDWIIRNSENPIGLNAEVINRTTAGRTDRTVVVRIEHINQPAPRIVYAITKLAKRFHPDAYAAANATPTVTPSPTAEPRATNTTAATGTTEAPGLTGFGTLTALFGVTVAVLLLIRT